MLIIILLFFFFSLLIFLTVFRNILYIILNAIAGFIDHVIYLIKRIFNIKGSGQNRASGSDSASRARYHSSRNEKKKKIFDSSDGEYVDFEEVK